MGFKGKYPQMVRETGFKLRQYRDGPLDWRLMGSYETERILREQNFELVDKALPHLSEAPLGTVLETHILDSGIAKYFVMSQYAIQYLICCRTYLDECVTDLKEAHSAAQEEIATLRKSLSESNNEVVQLHKRITQIEAIREVVYPCHLCPKNFISNEALNVHIGRKHRVATPPSLASGTGKDKERDKDTDVHLINTIKMELEIKQLKERLNAAEKNIKERSTGSKRMSPRQEQRTVGIQSNLAEPRDKDKDEDSGQARRSEDSERKEQLTGLAERLSNFEEWQVQLKQSNEQFIQDINKRLEGLSRALEQSKQASATTPPLEDRVATPCLEDLERILTEKVAEIGKISAHKLEEVVYHLEMGYNEKLEALERELKELSLQKKQPDPVQLSLPAASKIPKPVVVARKEETNIDRIRKQVESEFLKEKRDDDTFSIEEAPRKTPEKPFAQQVTQVQVHVLEKEQPSAGSSGSNPTYTKSPKEPAVSNKPETRETTDISESLSQEEMENSEEQSLTEEEGTEVSTSESEAPRNDPKPKGIKPPARIIKSPQKPLTRKDARKMVSRKLLPYGFDMKSKGISHNSLKRVNSELAEHRNKLKLRYPHFYATRNRIRKFVEKLCSTKFSEHAEGLLKHKSPLKPMEVPKNRMQRSVSSAKSEEDIVSSQDEEQDEEQSETSGQQSRSSSPPLRPLSRDFKARLEEILVKPAATVRGASKSALSTRPVPLPRKRVMFNTTDGGKSFNDSNDNFK
ncbi:cilium assembly protein DZIP1L [Drosophila biarmipes]|uniref:cilium assembly protein DZIP1L n=1 Tax=Drosophila biarmipes TaxID=125945 RepID=UPI0007E8A03C|nr:cilium assembly protein DZIP1L [Drosophila biarmipes]